ncbi:MAG TPA: uroporphyrinogen-III C-methyltransferase [Methylomirabilota bacterium]|nr:uroporphyrinogen-III C-methyltransferase [Methylomirabilota bacterium]
MKRKGAVYLVGAGPGDPGLLTLRGAELLKNADVVVHDALVNPALVKLASKSAEIIYAGKRSGHHAIPQDDLNQLLVNHAKAGKTVVRLKGGDPYVFGRGGEEAEELAKAGVQFEVIPGISSIIAAPGYAGIPVTHREHSSVFTVITGHEDPTKEGSSVDWAQLARTPGTKIILMGAERIRVIADALMQHGLSPTTPAAMVRWGTTGQQQTITGTLKDIAGRAQEANLTAPAITVIGEVIELREKLNWFEKRTLFGQRIVVTRSRDQASELARKLLDRGADVLDIPTIKIAQPQNVGDLVDAIMGLNAYDWLVFTSPNGVKAFFDYFFKAFDDVRAIGGLRIAAVGPSTAAAVRSFHLNVDVMPEKYVSSAIVKALGDYQSLDNVRILLMRAEVANREITAKLEERGAIVDDVACYRTVPETEDELGVAADFLEKGADWLTFTSASTVENFHNRFNLPEVAKRFPNLKFASIGPETTKKLLEHGLKPTTEADPHNLDGLVSAIEKALKRR